MCNWPQAISPKGITLFSNPMTRKAPQMRGSWGTLRPMTSTAAQSATAAQPTRWATAQSGPISSRAIRMETKDAPQIAASSSISVQARGVMDFCGLMGVT